MEDRMRELIREKSPAERIAMGCSMYDFAKELVKSAILREHPGLSDSEIRGEIFLRFYGNDFDLARQQKILRFLTKDEF